jgi:hypothetical protein
MKSLAFRTRDLALFNFLAAAVLYIPEVEGFTLGFYLADWMACMNAFTVGRIPLVFIFSGRSS